MFIEESEIVLEMDAIMPMHQGFEYGKFIGLVSTTTLCRGSNDDAMRVKVRLNQYWHSDSSERIY